MCGGENGNHGISNSIKDFYGLDMLLSHCGASIVNRDNMDRGSSTTSKQRGQWNK